MATYYVATTGDDGNAGTIGSPFLTIAFGVAQLNAGDTLLIRAGTYQFVANVIDSNLTTVRGGTDFGSGRIWIGAYSSGGVYETVIMNPAAGYGSSTIGLTTSTQTYLIFDHLILDGTNCNGGGFYTAPSAPYNRFQYGEVRYFQGAVSGLQCEGVGTELLYNHISYNGKFSDSPETHNVYWSSNGGLVIGNEIDHGGSLGIQVYKSGSHIDDVIIKGNFIHDNGRSGMVVSGDDNVIYNNIFSTNGNYGLESGFATPSENRTLIYNNTFTEDDPIYIAASSNDTEIINNILRKPNNAGSGSIVDDGSGTVETTNLNTDPDFYNGSGNYSLDTDYILLSTSDAIDVGTTLAVVTDDYMGTARPQHVIYDIGAYEYIFPPDPPVIGSVQVGIVGGM